VTVSAYRERSCAKASQYSERERCRENRKRTTYVYAHGTTCEGSAATVGAEAGDGQCEAEPTPDEPNESLRGSSAWRSTRGGLHGPRMAHQDVGRRRRMSETAP